jgi:hypothetical protein
MVMGMILTMEAQMVMPSKTMWKGSRRMEGSLWKLISRATLSLLMLMLALGEIPTTKYVELYPCLYYAA